MIKYSEEDTAKIISIYSEAEDKDLAVVELMKLLGKTKNSIISKLSVLKIYRSASPKPVARNPVTKLELIHKIAVLIDGEPEYLEGLSGSKKGAIEYLFQRIEGEMTYLKSLIVGEL